MCKSSLHPVPRDFDFLFGHWRVRNERLKRRLAGSRDWEVFEARMQCHPVLGGKGNVEEHVCDAFGENRWIGMALRLFDPRTQHWSIHWADNQRVTLEPPVVGVFEQGIGTFHGNDAHEGRPVRVRFIWDCRNAERPRWEQAFSTDQGANWETNWVMDFERLPASEMTA
ncbi:MAG: hypothetical protein ABI132_04425 [Rhodanobacteraceae bacterium]